MERTCERGGFPFTRRSNRWPIVCISTTISCRSSSGEQIPTPHRSPQDTRFGLLLGCRLIALGAGGIKPCVSANVGDQFGPSNQQLLPKVFSWFYFSVNIGSAFSS